MENKTIIKMLVLILTVSMTVSCNQKEKQATSTSSNNGGTGDNVSTRLGDLKLESGYPSEEAIKKLYDEISL